MVLADGILLNKRYAFVAEFTRLTYSKSPVLPPKYRAFSCGKKQKCVYFFLQTLLHSSENIGMEATLPLIPSNLEAVDKVWQQFLGDDAETLRPRYRLDTSLCPKEGNT